MPLIVFPEPVIFNVPPCGRVNEPEPVVARFPVRFIVLFKKLTGVAATVRLLKFCTPEPSTVVPEPVNITVPVLPL